MESTGEMINGILSVIVGIGGGYLIVTNEFRILYLLFLLVGIVGTIRIVYRYIGD